MNTLHVSATEFLEKELPHIFGANAAEHLTEDELARMSTEKERVEGVALRFTSERAREEVRTVISDNLLIAGNTGFPGEAGTLFLGEKGEYEFRAPLTLVKEDDEAAAA